MDEIKRYAYRKWVSCKVIGCPIVVSSSMRDVVSCVFCNKHQDPEFRKSGYTGFDYTKKEKLRRKR